MVVDVPDKYFTEAGRLESFYTAQPLSKRRASNASSRGPKSFKWPHKFLPPEKLAEAGFYYCPTQDDPDNVICFMCTSGICGWAEDDDPFVEHLKLSPQCGWAIIASIEAKNSDLDMEHPLSKKMIDARKATFGNRWPHEGKKGWKCKVKQLAEAGWIYKPTPEYDDFAACVYCGLGLDGWEPGDKPLDEHVKRVADCPFFVLINQPTASPTVLRHAKGRKTRASKASRLSTQSLITVNSEAPSFAELPAEEGDSILTAATNTTVTSQVGRKMAKGKKTAGKGRKTRVKKDEAVEVTTAPEQEVSQPEDDHSAVMVEQKPATKRGKKRASEAINDTFNSIEIEAPPSKRRATRTTESLVISDPAFLEPTVVDGEDDVSHVAEPAPRKRGRPKKASTSLTILDDPSQANEEGDSFLKADMELPLGGGEQPVAIVDPEVPSMRRESRLRAGTRASTAHGRNVRGSKITKADHAMFATEEMELDDDAIEVELEAMEIEASRLLPKTHAINGKKGRKSSLKRQAVSSHTAGPEVEPEIGTGLVSQGQAKGTEVDPEPEPNAESLILPSLAAAPTKDHIGIEKSTKIPGRRTRGSKISTSKNDISAPTLPNEENKLNDDVLGDSAEDTDANIGSQSTAIRGSKRSSTVPKIKAGRVSKVGKKATSRNIEEAINKAFDEALSPKQDANKPKSKRVARLKAKVHPEPPVSDISTSQGVNEEPLLVPEAPAAFSTDAKPSKAKSAKAKGKGKAAAGPIEGVETESAPAVLEPILPDLPIQQDVRKSLTPAAESPKLVPKELTPSPSPQSSDAENRPPSSKLSTTKHTPNHQTSRIPLAASTPTMSPSKRNIVNGLQSTQQWSSTDLDEIFMKSPNAGKENLGFNVLGDSIDKAKKGELTSPEKRMSVEEWILFNASVSEEKLRGECERMVGVFEREGSRAMRVLEGIKCSE